LSAVNVYPKNNRLETEDDFSAWSPTDEMAAIDEGLQLFLGLGNQPASRKT
jgi:hypothetical protein